MKCVQKLITNSCWNEWRDEFILRDFFFEANKSAFKVQAKIKVAEKFCIESNCYLDEYNFLMMFGKGKEPRDVEKFQSRERLRGLKEMPLREDGKRRSQRET